MDRMGMGAEVLLFIPFFLSALCFQRFDILPASTFKGK